MSPPPHELDAIATHLERAALELGELAAACRYPLERVMAGGRLTADVGRLLEDQQRRWLRLEHRLRAEVTDLRARATAERLTMAADPSLDMDLAH